MPAALGISYEAGLRACEVCNLKVKGIDGDRMLMHVDDGKGGRDRKDMLSPSLLDLLREYWRESRPEARLLPGKPKISPLSPRQLSRAFTSAKLSLGTLLRNALPGDAWPGSANRRPCTRCGRALPRICSRPMVIHRNYRMHPVGGGASGQQIC